MMAVYARCLTAVVTAAALSGACALGPPPPPRPRAAATELPAPAATTTSPRAPDATPTPPKPPLPQLEDSPCGPVPTAPVGTEVPQPDEVMRDIAEAFRIFYARVEHQCPKPARPGRNQGHVVFGVDGEVAAAWIVTSPHPKTPTAECVLESARAARIAHPPTTPYGWGFDVGVGPDPGTNANLGNFDSAAAHRALALSVTEAAKCVQKGKRIDAEIVLMGRGKVASVSATPPGAEADCVSSILKSATVPEYCGREVTLTVRVP